MKMQKAPKIRGRGQAFKVIIAALILLALSFLGFVLIYGVYFNKNKHKFSTEAAFTITSSLSDDDYNNNTQFEIDTLVGLQKFAETVNSGKNFSGRYIELGSHIDCQNSEISIGGSNPFAGWFNGKGYEIKNINISSSYYQKSISAMGIASNCFFFSLFPNLSGNAKIYGLKVKNIKINSDKVLGWGTIYTSGIAGYNGGSAQIFDCVVESFNSSTEFASKLGISAGCSVSHCYVIDSNVTSFNVNASNSWTGSSSCTDSLFINTNGEYIFSSDISDKNSLDSTYWYFPPSDYNNGNPMLITFITFKYLTFKVNNSGFGSIVLNESSSSTIVIKIPEDYTINHEFPNDSQSLTIAENEIIASPSSNSQFVNWTKNGDIITANLKYKPVAINIKVVDENKETMSIVDFKLNGVLKQEASTISSMFDIGVEIVISNISITDNTYYLSKVYYETLDNDSAEISAREGIYSHTVQNTATIYIEVKLKSYGLVLN